MARPTTRWGTPYRWSLLEYPYTVIGECYLAWTTGRMEKTRVMTPRGRKTTRKGRTTKGENTEKENHPTSYLTVQRVLSQEPPFPTEQRLRQFTPSKP